MVAGELEPVKMKDVGDGVVQEAPVVMGDDNQCAVSDNIQVISWLVEWDDVSLE